MSLAPSSSINRAVSSTSAPIPPAIPLLNAEDEFIEFLFQNTVVALIQEMDSNILPTKKGVVPLTLDKTAEKSLLFSLLAGTKNKTSPIDLDTISKALLKLDTCFLGSKETKSKIKSDEKKYVNAVLCCLKILQRNDFQRSDKMQDISVWTRLDTKDCYGGLRDLQEQHGLNKDRDLTPIDDLINLAHDLGYRTPEAQVFINRVTSKKHFKPVRAILEKTEYDADKTIDLVSECSSKFFSDTLRFVCYGFCGLDSFGIEKLPFIKSTEEVTGIRAFRENTIEIKQGYLRKFLKMQLQFVEGAPPLFGTKKIVVKKFKCKCQPNFTFFFAVSKTDNATKRVHSIVLSDDDSDPKKADMEDEESEDSRAESPNKTVYWFSQIVKFPTDQLDLTLPLEEHTLIKSNVGRKNSQIRLTVAEDTMKSELIEIIKTHQFQCDPLAAVLAKKMKINKTGKKDKDDVIKKSEIVPIQIFQQLLDMLNGRALRGAIKIYVDSLAFEEQAAVRLTKTLVASLIGPTNYFFNLVTAARTGEPLAAQADPDAKTSFYSNLKKRTIDIVEHNVGVQFKWLVKAVLAAAYEDPNIAPVEKPARAVDEKKIVRKFRLDETVQLLKIAVLTEAKEGVLSTLLERITSAVSKILEDHTATKAFEIISRGFKDLLLETKESDQVIVVTQLLAALFGDEQFKADRAQAMRITELVLKIPIFSENTVTTEKKANKSQSELFKRHFEKK